MFVLMTWKKFKNEDCYRCFENCLTSEAEDVCKCSLAAATVPRKPLLCTTKQFYHCYFPVLFKNYTDLVNNCKVKCPSPCSFWQYHKTVSYAHFPAPHARFFVDNDTEWDLLTHTIILEVRKTRSIVVDNLIWKKWVRVANIDCLYRRITL
jgi:hypothetical protein